METKDLIKDFLKLQNAYSFTNRKVITSDRVVQIAEKGYVNRKEYENEALMEPLIEHVGHLPIIAAFFHPYIEKSKDVDLGRALIMLSIHDIGETVTGDIFAYHKTDKDSSEEYEIAQSLLHSSLKPYLDEYEAQETLDAKYAKSIDVIAPNIHEVDMPYFTLERFEALGATIKDVVEKKRKFMEWDPVLLEVFDLLMQQYNSVKEGDLLFDSVPYDIK